MKYIHFTAIDIPFRDIMFHNLFQIVKQMKFLCNVSNMKMNRFLYKLN